MLEIDLPRVPFCGVARGPNGFIISFNGDNILGGLVNIVNPELLWRRETTHCRREGKISVETLGEDGVFLGYILESYYNVLVSAVGFEILS